MTFPCLILMMCQDLIFYHLFVVLINKKKEKRRSRKVREKEREKEHEKVSTVVPSIPVVKRKTK